jgi:hypothetical protein
MCSSGASQRINRAMRLVHLPVPQRAAFDLSRSPRTPEPWVMAHLEGSTSHREREIPVRSVEQRRVLDEAKQSAVRGGVIPKASSYVQQLQRFKAQYMAVGIQYVHGHRHQYEQDRYRVLTGWACPARGGPTSKQLTYEQNAIDRQARLAFSAELGHSRERISSWSISADSGF